ncbi:hypothetical protein BEN47_15340 [Hymenobacter lapidarius]|uniref:Uncharacterized protein n=1 Tax=Hymenobacter lapidarius TaxID=1908237 RepID=A0A1G1T2K0_9BACT|nr:hypothetical protein BEN47_15340 [Hymenobacter lapidarius]
MTDSPKYTLLLELQRDVHNEFNQSVRPAPVQPPVTGAAKPLPLLQVREAAVLPRVGAATSARQRRGGLPCRAFGKGEWPERTAVLNAAQSPPAVVDSFSPCRK